MTSFLINCIFSRNECWELRAADRSQGVLIHRQTHGRSEYFHRTKIWNITFFNLKIMIKMRRFASFLSYLTVNNESLGFWTVCWTEEVFWIHHCGFVKGSVHSNYKKMSSFVVRLTVPGVKPIRIYWFLSCEVFK